MITEKTLHTLEFDRVLEHLASHTSFSLGRALALTLRPSTDLDQVRELQQPVRECDTLLASRADLSLAGARDVLPAVSRTALGGSLDPQQLLDVQSTLECSDRLKVVLGRLDPEQFAWLAGKRSQLGSFREIVEAIARSIDSQGEILDSASPDLARIRAELRIAYQRLMDRLQAMLSSSTLRPALQEPLITMRNGRYVIPVRADARGTIKGIVHDHSASGATLYIEPLQTTELNNRWRELQLQEASEVERILAFLSERVAAQAPAITASVRALADLDLALAKARYGMATHGVLPLLDEQALAFYQARHPLLVGEVVPIDVRLGEDFRILLVTGPNTGGKTVALKTVGLLTIMTQAGLPIPVAAGSRAAVFEGVFADIGDEQSIEQSLSTFSGHLTNIISILQLMSANSLLLLDELGAGTDPAEGSALARSLLTYLLNCQVRVMATTHYSELKAFASTTDGVQNASVEFDVETLSPTYRLSIGLPGRSNALAIAQRLGLPAEIVAGSHQFLADEELRVETMLAQIQEDRERTAALLAETVELQRAAVTLRTRLEHEIQEIVRQREAIVQAARVEAEASVADLRRELDRAEAELRVRGDAPGPAITAARERVATALHQQPLLAAAAGAAKPEKAPAPAAIQENDLQPGDRVALVRTGQEGTVIALPKSGTHVEVQIGPFKTRVKRGDLRRAAPEPEPVAAAPAGRLIRAEVPPPSMELDMRGWRVEEVLHELERYINDAYLANLPSVRIIHGKGTGALRQVVREELATNPLVAAFRPAESREGGEGVTIAQLAV